MRHLRRAALACVCASAALVTTAVHARVAPIDAYHPDAPGGTGLRADWALARTASRRYPVILAGGLDPSNVAEAVRVVEPYAVDVASGVERAPGVKDPDKIRAFVERARAAFEEKRKSS